MKHYHNQYWTGSTILWQWIRKIFNIQYIDIYKFKDNDIIEVDVVCRNSKLFVSHTPFKPTCLFYGQLKYYFAKLLTHSDKDIYLYIEIKTSNLKTIDLLSDLIKRYEGKIKVLIGGKSKWFSRKRKYIATEVYFRNLYNNIEMFESFKQGKEIERVELYKRKSWVAKLNHW